MPIQPNIAVPNFPLLDIWKFSLSAHICINKYIIKVHKKTVYYQHFSKELTNLYNFFFFVLIFPQHLLRYLSYDLSLQDK
jgi:hypothetical protein